MCHGGDFIIGVDIPVGGEDAGDDENEAWEKISWDEGAGKEGRGERKKVYSTGDGIFWKVEGGDKLGESEGGQRIKQSVKDLEEEKWSEDDVTQYEKAEDDK